MGKLLQRLLWWRTVYETYCDCGASLITLSSWRSERFLRYHAELHAELESGIAYRLGKKIAKEG